MTGSDRSFVNSCLGLQTPTMDFMTVAWFDEAQAHPVDFVDSSIASKTQEMDCGLLKSEPQKLLLLIFCIFCILFFIYAGSSETTHTDAGAIFAWQLSVSLSVDVFCNCY